VRRIDEAASHAREALALTRRLGARGSEAHALALPVTSRRRAVPTRLKATTVRRWPSAASSACVPSSLTATSGLGQLYRRIGERTKAHEHLTTATTMYREMDMWFWLEKAEKALHGDERR
jgi:hypothetical protein